MRFKHTKILNQLSWKHCKFCNFNCKNEIEMKTHITNYRSTHNQTNHNSTQKQFNSEISDMCDKGYILYTFDSEEAQHLYLDQHHQQNC